MSLLCHAAAAWTSLPLLLHTTATPWASLGEGRLSTCLAPWFSLPLLWHTTTPRPSLSKGRLSTWLAAWWCYTSRTRKHALLLLPRLPLRGACLGRPLQRLPRPTPWHPLWLTPRACRVRRILGTLPSACLHRAAWCHLP